MRNHVDVWVMAFADTGDATVSRVTDVFGIDSEVAAQLVSSVPKMVKRDVEPSAALEFRRALQDLGAEIRVVATGTDPIVPEAPRLPTVDPPPMPAVDPVPRTPKRPVNEAPPPAETAPPRSSKTIVAIAAGLGGALLIGCVVWFLSGGEEEPLGDDVDSVCERELDGQSHAEAREWLGDPHHAMLGLADPRSAPGLVSSLYDAGATEVQVTQIHGTRLQSSAGTIVATFPPGGGEALRDAAETGLGMTGDMVAIAIDPHVDLGERYLRITLAPAHVGEGEADAWERARRERERSQAEGRGFGSDTE